MYFKSRYKREHLGPFKISFRGYRPISVSIRLPFRKTLVLWERNKR